jgi:hypothetical protein
MMSDSSSNAASLPDRPVSGPRLLEELGRVVADLLERGEQLEDQTGTLEAVGLLDRRHRFADHRLIEGDLLRQ